MSARSVKLIPYLLMLVVMGGTSSAVPPSPEAIEQFKQAGVWEEKIANLRAFEEAQPADMYETSRAAHLDRFRAKSALGAEAVDTIRVCVLLVDFPDFPYNDGSYSYPGGTLTCLAAGTQGMFDSLLFSVRGQDAIYNPTGSMTDYYMEVSYGQYFIQGDVHGWFTVPHNYSYYVGDNDGLGGGGAELARDAVLAANSTVNFTPYGNGHSWVDAVIIIHAGPGAEQGAYGIWSHRSNMSTSVSADGVILSGYTMQPEERFNENSIVHMGVFCHEWGHVLGIQDWYDGSYNQGSDGLGEWCLMAGGSWNDGGRRPAHINGWSKDACGFLDIQVLTDNISQAAIPQVETSPVAYMLKEDPVPGHSNVEWWIVENRQRVGFDAALPGSGLLIYHYDALGSQTNPSRYKMAVEEADGRRDLAVTIGTSGQASDPFPGYPSNNRNFHEFTVPDSRTNDGDLTGVSVMDISDSDSMMYADLSVYYAMPWPMLAGDSLTITDNAPGGNGDGTFVQGETLTVYLEVLNLMRMTYWPTLHLDVSDPLLEVLDNDQGMGAALNPLYNAENYLPIRVHIPEDFISSVVNFRLSVTSDSGYSTGDRSFTNTFDFSIPVGRTQILLVDDDNGRSDEYWYTQALDRVGLLFERWDKSTNGAPSYQDVSQYKVFLWMTGSYYPPGYPGATITAADIAFMKDVLDHGGNLLLGGLVIPTQIAALDSAFLTNYLHATVTGSASSSRRNYLGDSLNTVWAGMKFRTMNEAALSGGTPILTPSNGGRGAFAVTNSTSTVTYGNCGVTYDGSYRSILLSFGVELLSDNSPGFLPKDSLITRAIQFFARGATTDVEDDPGTVILPEKFALAQNYPNPFNPTTTIIYNIPPGDPVLTNLAIFNVLGQKVATLVDEIQGPGTRTVTWEAKNDQGARVASGVYFYRLVHGEQAVSKKMVLLK